jgi:hypothetical protein
MIRESAAKAEFMLAAASHSRNYTAKIAAPDFTINSIFAVWSWTPLEIFDVVDVRTRQKFAVSIVRDALETT